MGLQEYHAKRRFDKSPEPRGSSVPSQGALRFVVQKHLASRLHYDFRLEIGGTLKSWALPKGPSLNPLDKRLAVMVEDHPLEYAEFEGVIPRGNYGAGTVMIWDQGEYHPAELPAGTVAETVLQAALQKGHLSFVLQGKKLRGHFSLLKLKRGEENAWLLVKNQDEFATKADVLARDVSAATGRTMEAIAKESRIIGTAWQSKAGPRLDLSDAPRSPMPHKVKPMLATPASEAFDRPGWFFEIKWDGYRAIAEVEAGKVRLYSRQQLSFDNAYPPIVESLKALGHDAVLDGEIVVLDESGKPQFEWLQNYGKSSPGQLVYYVFDLLYLNGHDLMGLPLHRRKELLTQIVPEQAHVRISEHLEEHGVAFFNAVAERGLEGIVAKDAASSYRRGKRGPTWLKIKTELRARALICGYTKPKGMRQGFGALVLGLKKSGKLTYIGCVGTGFSQKALIELRARLDPLAVTASTFTPPPKIDEPVTWVKPELECDISVASWTESGHMRHPVFVKLQEAGPTAPSMPAKMAVSKTTVQPAIGKSQKLNQKKLDLRIGPRLLTLTNLDKSYWPAEGYTKGDVIEYYLQVAEFILPYLKDRPQSLHRHPNGIEGKSFFQKDVGKQPPPDWVQTVGVIGDEDKRSIRYLLCQEPAALIYLANLGCIELNPWNARVGSLDHPDYLLIDLDPEDIEFDQVVAVAQQVHKTLDRIGAASLCKTSGKRGLHIYVPLGAKYGHDAVKQFAELIVRFVNRELPAITSIVRLPSQRQKRVYLDWLQNGRGKTLAAPYSVRPYAGATVSAPLHWAEVRRGLTPSKFTIRTMSKRLSKEGDLWQPVLGQGIDLQACLAKMASMLS